MLRPIQSSALSGLQRARQGMQKAATEIARAPLKGSQVDLNRSLIELRLHEHAAKANIKTLKTANETLGTLIDELA
jgi:flagellar hook protein FlgE